MQNRKYCYNCYSNNKKQNKESSEEEDSTRSDSSEIEAKTSNLSSTRTTNNPLGTSTTNISSSMSAPNAKLEHLLKYWFLANGPNHEIQLMFKEYDLTDYDKFLGYDKQLLLDIKRKKHYVSILFNNQKIKMINDVLLYYKFMSKNKDNVIAEDPVQWVMDEFKEWRINGFPISNAAYTASLAGTTTTTTSTGPAVFSVSKKAKDALVSWRRGRRDSNQYPILENDNKYTD